MAEMNEKAILQFQDLDISFRTNAGTVHAIRGVNLDLQRGETAQLARVPHRCFGRSPT